MNINLEAEKTGDMMPKRFVCRSKIPFRPHAELVFRNTPFRDVTLLFLP